MAVQVVPCKPVEAVVRSAVAHKQGEPAAVGAVATELRLYLLHGLYRLGRDFHRYSHRFSARGAEFDVVGDLCPAKSTKCHIVFFNC